MTWRSGLLVVLVVLVGLISACVIHSVVGDDVAGDGDARSVGEQPPGSCPAGSVCGTNTAVACEAPVAFAAAPTDEACTPVAQCPSGSVCGSGVAVPCEPTTTLARDPTDSACRPLSECPEAALCDLGEGTVCAAECVRQGFRITADTAPTPEKPWVKDTDEPLRDLGRQDAQAIASLIDAPLLTPSHPALAPTPGPLPASAALVQRRVTIDASYAGRDHAYIMSSPGAPVWRSTGMFAKAGTVVTVELPPGLNLGDGGLNVQIGAHNDADFVWKFPYGQPIRRFPEVVHRRPLNSRIVAITSAFGGPIYVTVDPGTRLGPIEVVVSNAARAPHYVHGETDAKTWRAMLADAPAPWAELSTDKVVLTVPTRDLADIDVVALMEFWRKAMDAVWYLSAIEDNEDMRVERYLADPALEGIAYSGYPIHMAEKWTAALVDISAPSGSRWWTTFHEMGHNQQLGQWTFDGLRETTCNLWALYVLNTVAGVPRRHTHRDQSMGAAKRQARVRAYVDKGRNFAEDFQSGFNAYQGFLPLEVFMQLQEAFGWDLLREMNRQFRALPRAEWPKSSADKIQQIIIRSSTHAGVNLRDFYEDWGFPLTAETRRILDRLPPWRANPMDAYD